MWSIAFTSNALKNKKHVKEAKLEKRVRRLLDLIQENPFAPHPPYEKLIGDLNGYYSRRINQQHRLIYRVMKSQNVVIIHSM